MSPADRKEAAAPPLGSGDAARTPSHDPPGVEVERLYQPKVDRVMLRRLLQYARPYRLRILWAVTLLLLLSAGDLLFPLLTKRAIDVYIMPGDLPGLMRLTLAYLALLLAIFGLRFAQLVLTQNTGQRIMNDLRMGLFAHLETLDLRYFEKNPVGRVMTRLTGDVEVLNELFTSGLVSIFGDLLTLFGIMAVLLYLNVKLALVTFTVVPLLLTATMLFRARVRAAYALIRLRIAAINAFLQENIVGISLVQLFHREPVQRRMFEKLNADHRDAFLQSVLYYSVYFPVVEFLEAVALALILWYGGGESLRGILSLGALVAFIQYSERFFRPIRDLSDRYNILQGAMASSERIFDLLDTKPRIVSPASAAPPVPDNSVEFRNVRFSYLPGEEVLRGVSFTVRAGESVALVGQTGAGKTTVSSLLSRFYDVDAGSVLVGGRDVRDWNLAELRRRVGQVSQDVFLWSGGIRLNVALRAGRPLDQVEQAMRLVGIEDLAGLIDAEGKDRSVGERGAQLSAGQRQLVSFARVLASDPPILVLDEATSSVDTESEQKIRAALGLLMRKRTSLVIAHRLSTIRHVDRILVLRKGRLVEEGTHEELLAKGGIYAKYYEIEYRGQETPAIPPLA